MLSVKAVRWLMGWTEFSITAGTPRSAERFLNLAARQGIGLWDIRRDGDRFSARVGVRRYRDLCAPAGKRLCGSGRENDRASRSSSNGAAEERGCLWEAPCFLRSCW